MMGIFPFGGATGLRAGPVHSGVFMKSTFLRSGVALACALSLAACGGGGDLYLQGAVGGVNKDGLVLQNNGGNDTPVTVDKATGRYDAFQFSNRVKTDDTFNITVKSKPDNVESCTVNNGSGHANYYTIGQISVVCSPKMWKLNVQVSGLTTSGLILVNGTDNVQVAANATGVRMADVAQDAPYSVKVLTQPTGQTCTVSGGGTANNGSGIVGAGDVNGVTVTCS
jgi:hypothetical protein